MRHMYAQRVRHTLHIVDGNIAFTALHRADVGSVQITALGKVFATTLAL